MPLPKIKEIYSLFHRVGWIRSKSQLGQPGFFDIDDRLKRLSDQLETSRSAVDFELFQPEFKAALSYLISHAKIS
jgi:hypothetical protein